MAKLLQGENSILFFRKYADRTKKSAARLKFQAEHSISFEKETEAVKTKEGTINVISDGENTMDITSVAYAEDAATKAVWEELEEFFRDKELVEVWAVSLDHKGNGTNKYKGYYFQGYFTSFSLSAPNGDKVELSLSYAINGSGAKGDATLTKEQVDAIREAVDYDFVGLEQVSGK